jgi:hypothetical protein
MIRKSVQRFSLATNAERVCAEIMLSQRAKERDDGSTKSHRALESISGNQQRRRKQARLPINS